jgi:two-component system alkaline phosphatase synthesis response regulator PhoP
MEKKGVVQFGEIVIDFDGMELRRSGHVIPATYLEFKLLRFFVDNPQFVFSREELIRAVWPKRRRRTRRGVDNSISNLRKKLERNPAQPVYFQTVHRAGYKFVPLGAEMKHARYDR